MSTISGTPPQAAQELAQILFSDRSREEILHAIARLAHSALPTCLAASVTVTDHGQPYTAVSSAELATVLDEAQYETSEGPCLEAIRTEQEVSVPSYEREGRWPHFSPVVLRSQVASSLSLPLIVGTEAVGALNLYAEGPDIVMAGREAAEVFARSAATTLANALAFHRAGEVRTQLTEALEHRDVIGQAKGMMMADEGVTADAAFDRLSQLSQQSNRKLYEVAREMVEGDRS